MPDAHHQSEPKWYPLALSPEMARATREGRKTMTTRVLRLPEGSADLTAGWTCFTPERHIALKGRFATPEGDQYGEKFIRCPFGERGDRLWVRERHRFWTDEDGRGFVMFPGLEGPESLILHGATYPPTGKTKRGDMKWRPARFMPRVASRTHLKIVSFTINKLQEMTVSDVMDEGCVQLTKDSGITWKWGFGEPFDLWPWREWCHSPYEAFAKLWNSLNAERGHSWESNPTVLRIRYKLLENSNA